MSTWVWLLLEYQVCFLINTHALLQHPNRLKIVDFSLRLRHDLQDFIHPRWCRISSINSMFLRPRESWSRVFRKKSREKLQDNVFVAVHVMVQHTISASSAEAALYKLDDISEQLDSYVYLGSHEFFSTSTYFGESKQRCFSTQASGFLWLEACFFSQTKWQVTLEKWSLPRVN